MKETGAASQAETWAGVGILSYPSQVIVKPTWRMLIGVVADSASTPIRRSCERASMIAEGPVGIVV